MQCMVPAVYRSLIPIPAQVNEPKEENSGIPQGAFVKRHHIPKGRGEFYTILDFTLGSDLTFYGRTFRVVDCDAFTAVSHKG